MFELFQFQFFRNAFAVGILIAIIFGIFSFFAVMRKMSFLGVGIAHAAFGGVALGILLGIHPLLTALGFCILTALLIGTLKRQGKISIDSGIGILFSFTMALGAIFLALKRDYTFDLNGYLFGSILGVTQFDLIITGIAFAVFIPFMLFTMKRLVFLSFDEEAAMISGLNVRFLDSMLMIILAGIVVVSIKVVGIILVSALVVLPASFGLLITHRYQNVILIGVIYALVMVIGGLFLSYYLNSPPGATIVTLGTLTFFVGVGIRRLTSN